MNRYASRMHGGWSGGNRKQIPESGGDSMQAISDRYQMAVGGSGQATGIDDPINKNTIAEALAIFEKYKEAKDDLTKRLINAEEWWKNNHWERFGSDSSNENDPRPTSAWLFNSVINKHADFADNYPSPAILPREQSDESTAKMLSDIVPVILEQNGYDKTYSECSWDKPKTGTAVYGVFWDQEKENGLGDIEIKRSDLMNLFWEPGIEDIQESKDLFYVDIVDLKDLENEYPELRGKMQGELIYRPEYAYVSKLDTAGKVNVWDWYYKRKIYEEVNGIHVSRTVLHYCKFIPGHVLYSSENDPERSRTGWYNHGKYPFVFDVMFPDKGSPAGFGYLDVMINPQEYIDKVDQVILKHAALNRPRYFVSGSSQINESEFTDLSADLVHCSGPIDDSSIKQIKPPEMSANIMNIRQAKIDELKETSGNRDFSQGSTTSGVTAASAIAALQEAGSKLSRDMIKGTYTAHAEVVTLTIELMRQFYDMPRCYRITQPNGNAEYVTFTNTELKPQSEPMMNGDISIRKPVFDIKVSAQKSSLYSRIANNELAKELYGMGVFNPENSDQALAVIKMMDFDKRDEVMKQVQENGTMFQQIQRMQNAIAQMADLIYQTTGNQRIYGVMEGMGIPNTQDPNIRLQGEQATITNSIGDAIGGDNSAAGKARQRAATATEVGK